MTRERLQHLKAAAERLVMNGQLAIAAEYTEMITEIERAWRQVTELQERGNKQLAIQRGIEQESNQQYAENILLRNECIRLRADLETLSNFLVEAYGNAADPIPEQLAAAVDNYFPPAAPQESEAHSAGSPQ